VDQIGLETMRLEVLAKGATAADVSNRRGHLFESFLAQLLGHLGFREPRTEDLNVTSQGVEIDVMATAKVTGHPLMAECKAYSSNVRVPALTSFLGKYLLEHADNPQLAGLFVALPRLTPEAKEKADAAAEKFPLFRHLGTHDICELLIDAGLLPPIPAGPALKSDVTVFVTEHGLALGARELDPATRGATRVAVWSAEVIPSPLLDLVALAPLADGLPVSPAGESPPLAPVAAGDAPTIVPVYGSTSDFEYQLPAAPEFFVGRKTVADRLAAEVRGRKAGGALVINAKSGWGKSSLALRLANEARQAGGVGFVLDSRTAERPDFVIASLEYVVREAAEAGVLRLPEDAAFSSLASIVRTVAHGAWDSPQRPVLLFFDQFENAFRDRALTREFRDLTLLVRELASPLTIGFAWKTDLVGWTEDHPYDLRDEIRASASLAVLEPLGPREIETLLRRLEKALGGKLDRELRRRLREFSQGLPWLFKKLASHILSEVQRGVTQEHLARESLNVQSLFESDLQALSPQEEEGLRSIARSAPVVVSDLEEVVPSAVLQSLLNRRLVVQVGERIDTYWDIFRDFLLTGRVAIEESYILRYGPSAVARLLRRLFAAGGDLTVGAAAKEIGSSVNVVWNLSRELRLMGIANAEANRVILTPTVRQASDAEQVIREQVASALRPHKIHSIVDELLEKGPAAISFGTVASELPRAFPAVEANAESWLTYARAFCQWMAYAGLIRITREGVERSHGEPPTETILSGTAPVRVRGVFPQAPAGPSEQLLQHLSNPSVPRPPHRQAVTALRDLTVLGAVNLDERDRVSLARRELVTDGQVAPAAVEELVRAQPGGPQALDFLRAKPHAPPEQVGEVLKQAIGATWSRSTLVSTGKYFRSWARLCGYQTRRKPPPQEGGLLEHPAAESL
jgi:hypothetical protein